MTIFLIMLFASLVYADNCSLTLSLNGNNDIYASNVYDDDGSIQFVDVFITDVEVTQYSFEAVSQGLILVESVPLGSEMSFSYSDSDGSMACIGIFGNIKEKGDRVSKPTLLYGAEFTPRLAEDNLSIYLDLAVDVNADHDFETVNLEYGYASGSYALSQALYQDGAQYKTTIGPFDKKVSIYSKVFGSGGGFDQTLYLKEHHFEVVTTDEDVCAEVVSLEGKESGANEQVQKEQEETNPKLARFADIDSQLTLTYFPDEELIRATTVVDDDSSIELVLIHIIDGESDSSYEYHGIVQGQSFDIVIPESATAYYNFSDYDGTMNGWGLFQPINNDTPVIPPEDPVDLIDSATIVAVPNSGYTSFELEITMHPESEADIAEAYLRYGFSENDYSEEMILDYDSNPEITQALWSVL